MPNIIQIEELIYGRLKHVNKAEWLDMLLEQGIDLPYARYGNDYLLFEQTDYRFSEGKYISSERVVYNTKWSTYHINHNGPNPDNTEEIVTIHYDAPNDRYFVYYVHYPQYEAQALSLDYICSEADLSIAEEDIQKPPRPIEIKERIDDSEKQFKQEQPKTEKSNEHRVGGTVFHKKYGKGIILSIDERYVSCRFGKYIVKKFQNPQAFEQGFLK